MRNGFKVFDADTHLQPSVETLSRYMDNELLGRKLELEPFLREVKTGRAGQILEPPFNHWYRFESVGGWGVGKPRHLGESGPRAREERHFQNFMGSKYPSRYSEDWDIDQRIAEMDEEGERQQKLWQSWWRRRAFSKIHSPCVPWEPQAAVRSSLT